MKKCKRKRVLVREKREERESEREEEKVKGWVRKKSKRVYV